MAEVERDLFRLERRTVSTDDKGRNLNYRGVPISDEPQESVTKPSSIWPDLRPVFDETTRAAARDALARRVWNSDRQMWEAQYDNTVGADVPESAADQPKQNDPTVRAAEGELFQNWLKEVRELRDLLVPGVSGEYVLDLLEHKLKQAGITLDGEEQEPKG